jgi:Glyoxalase/Bleomycin resistance protein/Dioxygenase superfamily
MNTVSIAPRNTESTMPGRAIVPTKLAHIVLHSPRFAPMVLWYKTVLGAHATFESTDVAFLTYDDEHHRVAIVNTPGMRNPEAGVAGFHHVAFTYASLGDLLLTYERLAAGDIAPYWAVNHGMTTSLYYHDLDGNRVELQVDNFATAAEGIAYCATPEFAENPVGVDIDPAYLLRRMRAGDSEGQLKVRSNIGPRGLMDFPKG